jgi:acetyl esterase/lipase
MKNSLKLFLLFAFSVCIHGQNFVLPLYTGEIPNSIFTGAKENVENKEITKISNVQNPNISVFLPSKRYSTGQAVIVCPGGGYWIEAYDIEGNDIAHYLNSIGVAAVVLKYRLPTYGNCKIAHKAPLMDAQRAMRIVRQNATKWNIEPNKIGIMGFSAGGHLASTLGTHFDYGNKTATDSVEKQSCRPNFMILIYPVISFTEPCTNVGCRDALLGKNPDKDLLIYYSNELQVKEDTPPTFFALADNDTAVPVENSLLMYKALRAKKIPVDLHILSEGGHGFGLGLNNELISTWTVNLRQWLKSINIKK